MNILSIEQIVSALKKGREKSTEDNIQCYFPGEESIPNGSCEAVLDHITSFVQNEEIEKLASLVSDKETTH